MKLFVTMNFYKNFKDSGLECCQEPQHTTVGISLFFQMHFPINFPQFLSKRPGIPILIIGRVFNQIAILLRLFPHNLGTNDALGHNHDFLFYSCSFFKGCIFLPRMPYPRYIQYDKIVSKGYSCPYELRFAALPNTTTQKPR
jgi:hypothetical protein